jgi:hypothetical protein
MSEAPSRPTVGQLAGELLAQRDQPLNAVEVGASVQRSDDYLQGLRDAATTFKEYCDTDFFIEVITKKEPLMENVLRNYFIPKRACPTPNYDQSVFKYRSATDDVEYVWTIPSRDACFYLYNNANYVDKSEHQLLQFVLDFASGELYKLCKKLNGEAEDSPLIDTNI